LGGTAPLWLQACSEFAHENSLPYLFEKQTVLGKISSDLATLSPGFGNLTFYCYIFSKKSCFLSFEKQKLNFTILALSGKIFMATYGKIR